MIKVRYEKYYNDYITKYETITLFSLNDLANWMFAKTTGEYKRHMYFADPNQNHEFCGKLKLDSSSIHTSDDCYIYWIHQIEKDGAIIYSTGKFTNGICHWNEEVKQWLLDCRKRMNNPKFNFG